VATIVAQMIAGPPMAVGTISVRVAPAGALAVLAALAVMAR